MTVTKPSRNAEGAVSAFIAVAERVPGIMYVHAKSSGPAVEFVVSTSAPQEQMVQRIEEQLYPLAQAGTLPPIGYEIRDPSDPPGPDYVEVFSA